MATTITKKITATVDDGFWYSTQTGSFITSALTGIGSNTYDMNCFFRFTNITVPQSATITACTITLTAKSTRSDTPEVNCYFNASDNAVAPTTYAEAEALSLSGSVAWSVTGWNSGTGYATPELKTILQEIVDRSGWSSGNAVMLVIKDRASTATEFEIPNDYTDSTTTCAEISITYEPAVEAVPFILTSSLYAYSVDLPDSMGYAYEENDTGTSIDLSLQTGDRAGQNILQQKQLKSIYYDVNTHGKDVTLTVYIDDVAQTPTFTINKSSRTRDKIVDIPDVWQGYRYNIKLSCEGVTDDDLEIYEPFALQYTTVGV
jgi:hypothetical protein